MYANDESKNQCHYRKIECNTIPDIILRENNIRLLGNYASKSVCSCPIFVTILFGFV